eukprot:scaffold72528_cov31-Tisochrysis_lutea.AAC.1
MRQGVTIDTSSFHVSIPAFLLPVQTNFVVGCDGARRRDSPLYRAPRRGRPPSLHGPIEATASVIRGRAGAVAPHVP